MDSGILQSCSDFGKIQIVLPDHLLAFLEFDPADILTGGNLQILMEQRRQITGADVHHPGHQGNRKLLPDMGADILLGLADNFILTVDGIGSLQLISRRSIGLPEQNQQQLIQQGNGHVIGIRIHSLLFPKHLLQQGHRLLGHPEFPVQQAGQVAALHIKGNGDEPGRNLHIRILHMPLSRAVQSHIPLFQHQIQSIRYGMQRSLIHISQFQQWVGFSGKQKSPLLLVVKEGVDIFDLQPVAYSQVAILTSGANLPEHIRRKHFNCGLLQKRGQGKINSRIHANILVQIEVEEVLIVQRNRKNRHTASAIEPTGTVTAIHRCVAGQ